jgi:hypothetical protein
LSKEDMNWLQQDKEGKGRKLLFDEYKGLDGMENSRNDQWRWLYNVMHILNAMELKFKMNTTVNVMLHIFC